MENQLKNGDCILFFTSFKINDWTTYLPVFIRFFQNFWSFITGKYCPYNHIGIYSNNFIYESQYKFARTHWKRRLENNPNHLILRPNFNFSNEILEVVCLKEWKNQSKYGIKNLPILAFDFLTNEKIPFKFNPKRKVCSQMVSFIYHHATFEKDFKDWGKYDPKDFYESDKFTIIGNK